MPAARKNSTQAAARRAPKASAGSRTRKTATKAAHKLRVYGQKRNFGLTSEPGPVTPKTSASSERIFVVQKHADDAAAQKAGTKASLVEQRPESVLSGKTLEELAAKKSGRAAKSRGKVAAKKPGQRPSGVAQLPGTADVLELVRKLPLPFTFTHLEKVLYPEQGLRKGDLAAYFASVALWMLPQVARRPLTLVRCPDGRQKHCFYQKHPSAGLAEAVGRVPIQEERKVADYLFVEDLPGLLALVQNGVLEMHTWVCHVDRLERPDQLVFDLDPDEKLPFSHVKDAALLLRERLAALELTSFLKTSGGKGLHVVLPVTRRHDWEVHKAFARSFVEKIARAQPSLFVTDARKNLRKGRIFLDYLRNGRGATAVTPYSPRARENAPVATPLHWHELSAATALPEFTVSNIPERLSTLEADPWRDYASVKQALPRGKKSQIGAETP